MAKGRESLYSFNKGVIDPRAISRLDVKRATIAAEIQQNWMPHVLGSMMLRPGTQYLGTTEAPTTHESKFIPFVKSTTDTALIELCGDTSVFSTSALARIWINDAPYAFPLVSTVEASLGAALRGDFFSGWAVNDEAGATSTFVVVGPTVQLRQSSSNGYAAAIVDQTFTVALAYRNIEHAVYINVAAGPVVVSIGTSVGDDSYVTDASLKAGIHILAFTPTGDFSVRIKTTTTYKSEVTQAYIYNYNSTPQLIIASPYAESNLDQIRWEQSADVIYLSCSGVSPRQIERRGVHSWSLVKYEPPDGPFRLQNTGYTTITPSAIDGNITLAASRAVFRTSTTAGHVGTLWRLQSAGQTVSKTITAQNQFTNAIKVSGVGDSRVFYVSFTGYDAVTGDLGSIVTLQVSFGVTGNWVDTGHQWTAAPFTSSGTPDPLPIPITAAEDNTIQFFRLGVKTGAYTARTPTITLTYANGSISGVVQITAVTDTKNASAKVLTPLGGTGPVTLWNEGEWSDYRGWPSSVALHDGRLWWGGVTKFWASVSDAYDSFDDTVVGDSGPLARTIGSGPVDTVQWMVSLLRLIAGTEGSEKSLRASAVDDVITPTNFNVKPVGEQGSTTLPAVKIDQNGVFVSRSGARAYLLEFGFQFYDYTESDLTVLCPRILRAGVVRIAAQRQPDTRIHFVMADGTVVICVFDKNEDVKAFVNYDTQGIVEDVCVLPAATGDIDDRVYYVVKRTINGVATRYLERWAQELDCQGGTLNKQADCFKIYSGGATTVITGLSHLEGQQVVVWGDGADVGTNDDYTQIYTVHGGQITLSSAVSNAVIGLPYTATFKSAKLGHTLPVAGASLNVQKRVANIGLVLANVHKKGLRFGPDFNHLDDMPQQDKGVQVDTVRDRVDDQPIPFPGNWDADARVCMQAQAPRPVTVCAMTVEINQ